MWWKKLLYFLLVIVLGLGITTISASICFNTLSKHYIAVTTTIMWWVMCIRKTLLPSIMTCADPK